MGSRHDAPISHPLLPPSRSRSRSLTRDEASPLSPLLFLRRTRNPDRKGTISSERPASDARNFLRGEEIEARTGGLRVKPVSLVGQAQLSSAPVLVLWESSRKKRGSSRKKRAGRGSSPRSCQAAERRPEQRAGGDRIQAMDSQHWISRLAVAKRFYAAQLGHVDDMPGMGMEEVEMEDDGDMEMELALELGEPAWPDVACPYCYEDHDVESLCVHLEEDHPYEPHPAPCPICSQKITRDMLNHITMQHGYLFKNGHRSRRYIIPDSHAISLLSRDLRGTHLQALLGGRHSHSHRSSNTATTNISSDPLLSSFGLGFATSDAPAPSKPPSSISDGPSVRKETPPHPWESSIDPSLTREEREQKRQQATDRATFVQGLVLSTIFGD